MLNVLINAYAISPDKGSEPGMAWNWATNIARHCKVVVITETEFKDQILAALPGLPQGENMQFRFVDIGSDKIRQMCWNQGDWRFYWYYRKWQLDALEQARQVVAREKIDLLHQLNMIGYREPGYLWRIEDIPLVWGPVGGFGEIPGGFVRQFPVAERARQTLKNLINSYQFRAKRVQTAIAKSAAILAANSAAYETLTRFKKEHVYLINDTASYEPPDMPPAEKGPGLQLCWAGKNAPRKALFLAVDVMKRLADKGVVLKVVGVSESEVPESYKSENIKYLGMVPHAQALECMRSSDALFFTSLHEGTPHVVLESLHLGVPVICHDAWGQGDVVDERCGIKVAFESPEVSRAGFLDAVESLLQNPEQLDVLSQGAVNRAREITWSKRAAEVVGIYKQVLSPG
jgi:glycosyltransferase involved in cell wall biosynthesis